MLVAYCSIALGFWGNCVPWSLYWMSVCAACISLCLSRWGSCAVMASLSLKGWNNNLWCGLSLPELQKILDSHRPHIWPDFKQTWHNLFRLTTSNQGWISSDVNCSHSASSWSLEQHRRLAPLPSWFFFPALLRVVFGLFILIGTAEVRLLASSSRYNSHKFLSNTL